MRYLLSGAVIAAAIIAAPAWAQNPSGGNGMGVPGPNPGGGGGLTPYSGGGYNPAASAAAVSPHHAVRHAKAMHAHHMHMAAKAALAGDTTAQLNRQELARIQAGNVGNPPAPPAPSPAPPGK